MKNILALTDFSEVAEAAVEAAFKLAYRYEAALFIYHDLMPGERVSVTLNDHPQIFLRAEGTKDAMAHVDIWRELSRVYKVPLQFVVTSDELLGETEKLVEEEAIDLIVMGNTGAGGRTDAVWGSSADEIIQTINCPILLVKDRILDCKFDELLFAAGFDEDEQLPFVAALKLLEIGTGSKVHLTAINTPSFFSQPTVVMEQAMLRFGELAAPVPVALHFRQAADVSDGVLEAVTENRPDLLILPHNIRKRILPVFANRELEELIATSTVPLLLMPHEGKLLDA